MRILGVPPVIGQAYRHLRELRIERGPLGAEAAAEELRRWYAAQPHP
ncbi:MAG: hypothetical protein M3467_01180 [Actinomycetota bacterium]|nr:hypothetical protein [Acidothermales bacterium]MDQ3430839.1 hypothetical protein [Actinomycetota bacterium]